MKLSLMASVLVCVALVSCRDSQENSAKLKEQVFSDTAVTHFEQVAGIAQLKKSPFDYFIGKAYAVDGNIRCYVGASISFNVEALGEALIIDTKCNDSIDLKIRQELLGSLQGKKLLRYDNGKRADEWILDFTSNPVWGVHENVEASASTAPAGTCKNKYEFDKDKGIVTISFDTVNTLPADVQTCLDSEFSGATEDDYRFELKFRFKDGDLQLDNRGIFVDDGDTEIWCISADGQTCDDSSKN